MVKAGKAPPDPPFAPGSRSQKQRHARLYIVVAGLTEGAAMLCSSRAGLRGFLPLYLLKRLRWTSGPRRNLDGQTIWPCFFFPLEDWAGASVSLDGRGAIASQPNVFLKSSGSHPLTSCSYYPPRRRKGLRHRHLRAGLGGCPYHHHLRHLRQ